MYLHSRSKRWLGVLQKSLAVSKLTKKTFAMFAEAAASGMKGARVISERDREVQTLPARDPLALTFESQQLDSDSWLAQTLAPVAQALENFSFDDGFDESLEALSSATESVIPLLQERTTDPKPSIDEIVEDLERALLISMVVSLTSHNVLLQKVSEWEGPHERFLQGNLPADVGHYFDVRTLSYVETGGPGRIHMQDLVFAIDAGATLWTVGGTDYLDNYPEVQAVAYAQWFTYAFALWEEQFRGRIAEIFGVRCSDVLNNNFGDIRLIRNDFVHNKGICDESAGITVLDWGLEQGQPMTISAEQLMSLITLFPRDELRTAPTPLPPGDRKGAPGKVDPHVLEDAQKRARELGLSNNELLDAAFTAWLAANT